MLTLKFFVLVLSTFSHADTPSDFSFVVVKNSGFFSTFLSVEPTLELPNSEKPNEARHINAVSKKALKNVVGKCDPTSEKTGFVSIRSKRVQQIVGSVTINDKMFYCNYDVHGPNSILISEEQAENEYTAKNYKRKIGHLEVGVPLKVTFNAYTVRGPIPEESMKYEGRIIRISQNANWISLVVLVTDYIHTGTVHRTYAEIVYIPTGTPLSDYKVNFGKRSHTATHDMIGNYRLEFATDTEFKKFETVCFKNSRGEISSGLIQDLTAQGYLIDGMEYLEQNLRKIQDCRL